MKMKLDEVKVTSFVTAELAGVRGGADPPTEAANCTGNCGGGTGLFCPTQWCPSDWNECGHTDLC